MSDDFAVQTFELAKEFNGLRAVDGIDLKIREGELFSLLGPNGAGKTTTINMLCCLLKPTKGTARVAGYDVLNEPGKVKGHIGVSPQETVLSERLNSWENLSLFGKIYGMSSKEIRERSEELLERVGLLDRAKDQVRKFSGGMKRRLNLILALIHDPQILFLDEPTLGLDPQSRRAIWEYIESLKGKKTILLTTHYMEEADFLSDMVAIIDSGKIVALGTPNELKKKFADTGVLRVSTKGLRKDILEELKAEYETVNETAEELKIVRDDLDLKEVVDFLYSRNVSVYSAAREEPTLEDVFLRITGKRLRD